MSKRNKGNNIRKDSDALNKIHTMIAGVEVIEYVDGKLVKRRIDAPENTELTPQNLERLKNQIK